jgi:hypothetical protein
MQMPASDLAARGAYSSNATSKFALERCRRITRLRNFDNPAGRLADQVLIGAPHGAWYNAQLARIAAFE